MGRNKEENQRFLTLSREGDMVLEVQDFPSPTSLMRGKNDLREIKTSAAITLRYSKAKDEETARVSSKRLPGEKKEILLVSPQEIKNMEGLRITDGRTRSLKSG